MWCWAELELRGSTWAIVMQRTGTGGGCSLSLPQVSEALVRGGQATVETCTPWLLGVQEKPTVTLSTQRHVLQICFPQLTHYRKQHLKRNTFII